ncbi:MAG: A/G-specific adenine glycosylase [Polyangiaceae bacterium]
MGKTEVGRPKHAHAAAASQSLDLQRPLLGWYMGARRDLPWRRTRDPYAIWLSEIMLQQTRVDTVIPYYERFMAAFPTVGALAEAPLDDVLSLWSGLGYYRRARMMHSASKQVTSEMGGTFPSSPEALLEVQGIGRYTAGAVASIAFGHPAPLVDGNVARVLARIFAIDDDVRGTVGLAKIWKLAGELVPAVGAGDWNQALMELGAMVCVPRDPRCLVCPVRASCAANAQGRQHELPVLKAKTKPVAWSGMALVGSKGTRVLLARRRQDRLFGGLWEPPTVPSSDDPRGAFEELLGLRLPSLHEVGEVKHVLSHRRMTLSVHHATLRGAAALHASSVDYDAIELVERSRIFERGVSTLAKKILAQEGRAKAVRAR